MELRAGYKRTEVGVIPEEWDVLPLASLGRFWKGQGIRKSEAVSGTIPCIRYGEIYTHHNDVIRQYHSFISPVVASNSRRLTKGDILFAGSGETKEEIGKAVAFVDDLEAYAGGDIVILTPGSACSEFLGYVLNSPVIAKQKASKGQGDAVVHISSTALGAVLTPIPPLPEQRAIAAVLGDVDALLGGLERLIDKKRDIKRAAMQQLLTGEARLPGFRGAWETVPLTGIVTKTAGFWGLEKGDVTHQNYVGVIRAGDISPDGRLTATAPRYFSDPELTKAQCKLGDVVITGSGSVGKVWWCDGRPDIAASNFVRILRPISKRVDGRFLFQLLLSEATQRLMVEHVATGVMANLGSSFFTTEWLHLPPLPEQCGIAEILSDMDAELEALEARRDKTRDLKQAMMQELLTGSTRLV